MISTYFFIPGNHPKLKDKISTIDSDYLIIDLEDSISQNEFETVLGKIIKIRNKQNLYVRPRLFDGLNADESTFKALLNSGFRNFIVPKFRNLQNLRILENILDDNMISDASFVLLVENPESLFSLQDILYQTKLKITGVGFGSQDYCNETGMAHMEDYLKFPRFMISGIAKSFGKISIDIACMSIGNDTIFLKELDDAQSMGFDAKFIIHPHQLKLAKEYKTYTEAEVLEAKSIMTEFERMGNPAVFVYNGRAVEPPHIRNYRKIVSWDKKYGSK